MNHISKRLIAVLCRISDFVLAPLTFLGGLWLCLARRYGIEKLPITRSILLRIGVFPIRNHYYEPQFRFEQHSGTNSKERPLPGIDFNVEGQLEFLSRFRFQEELRALPRKPTRSREFYYENEQFGAGDAEYLYSLVRTIKPRRITEIGCGFSTLIIRSAINQNKKEDRAYDCLHTCVEPYENPWLGEIGVRLLRQTLETLPWSELASLEANDVLFIDSSHVIRPDGDVLRAQLEILPRLKPGVYVHIHDIFTPFDYPEHWMRHQVRFWNEQYLVEALLTENSGYSVIGALNFLSRRFPDKLAERFPVFASEQQHAAPGSFWMLRR